MSGKSKKDFRKDKKLKYDVLFITPYDEKITSRGWLYDRINLRVDIMFDSGLMDEINNLLKLGFKENDFGMKTIGYEEIMKYKNGVLSLEEAKELIKKNSRNYAKRQLTWFRKYE